MIALHPALAPMATTTTETVGTPWINISIFGAFVVVTMVIVLRASKSTSTAADYYAGGRGFSGTQNGLAIAGDYLSAASFLGIVGAIAIQGYDGFLYSIGFLVAWLVALLLIAEPDIGDRLHVARDHRLAGFVSADIDIREFVKMVTRTGGEVVLDP